VSEPRQRGLEVLLQRETCMVRADGDAHRGELYYARALWRPACSVRL
jgi:hypothetical protein